MTERQMIEEIGMLISKITKNEELVYHAQQFWEARHHDWSPGIEAYFLDLLAKKRDMIEYEWDRVRRMGEAIAAGREYMPIDF